MRTRIILAAAIFATFAVNAIADEATFDANHPRRAQGNKIKSQDHQIRQEERSMASQNGGHITKQEQRTLNKQENHTSREIKNK